MVCILIAGMPASGKTTWGRKLSRELKIPMLSKDDFKEILFDRLGFQNRQEKVRLGQAAMDLLYAAAQPMLSCGLSVILENNFEDESRPGLVQLLEKTSCPALTVMFDGNTKAVYERFCLRDQSPERHRGHVVNTVYPEIGPQTPAAPISLEQFERSIEVRGYRRFSVGTRITADCTDLNQLDFEALSQAVCSWIAQQG